MNKNLNRFFTPPLVGGDNYDMVRATVRSIAAPSQARRVLIVTKELQHAQLIVNLTGKQISKTKATPFPGTVINIVHQSVKNVHSIPAEVFLAMGLDSDALLFIEPQLKGKYLLAAPWLPGELDKWAKITGALDLSTGEKLLPFAKPDCPLQQALSMLKSINTGNHLHLHDGDRDLVKTIFTGVFKNHMATDRNELEAFLYTEFGWPKSVIENVLKIHDALKDGRTVHGAIGADAHELFGKWQEACKDIQST